MADEHVRSIRLDIQRVDSADVVRWQDEALCIGHQATFDLSRYSGEIGESDRRTRAELKQEVREKRELAEPICFECPVYNECWFDAYNHLPVSVIQAGAVLTSAAEGRRKRQLEEALIRQQDWIRKRQIARWREERSGDSQRESEAG